MLPDPWYHQNMSGQNAIIIGRKATHDIVKEVGQVFDLSINPRGSGKLTKKILRAGTEVGNGLPSGKVTVHYQGWVLDENGKKLNSFDSSWARKAPFTFKLAMGNVIPAWEHAVSTMVKGEVAEIVARPEYCYGQSGSGEDIPPNSTLLFEVEMIDWQPQNAIFNTPNILMGLLIIGVLVYIFMWRDLGGTERIDYVNPYNTPEGKAAHLARRAAADADNRNEL